MRFASIAYRRFLICCLLGLLFVALHVCGLCFFLSCVCLIASLLFDCLFVRLFVGFVWLFVPLFVV